MGRKQSRLLERARVSPGGWNRNEIDRLYKAFGFIIWSASNHDIAEHPVHKHLKATLTRSSGDIHRDYVTKAVELIDELKALEEQTDG